jgi:hypothetical protein
MHIANGFTCEELQERANTTEKILSEIRQLHAAKPIHLFLSYFYNSHFDPAAFDDLRRLGIPSVNFYCNSIYQFANVAAIASKVDFSWHAEKHARDAYLQVGAKPIWVQMAADPRIYRPLKDIVRQPVACFVGQRYADRDRCVAALVRAQLPLNIYGPGWAPPPASQGAWNANATHSYLGRKSFPPGSAASYFAAMGSAISKDGLAGGLLRIARQVSYRRETSKLSPLFAPIAHASVPFENICDILAAHEVCLNFSNVWGDGRPGSELIPHVRLRDFEAPMCRACYITGETDEIQDFYELGKEIATYRTKEELVDKTRFYLTHPSAAERLRSAGYLRAIHCHTWIQRFKELFSKVGV